MSSISAARELVASISKNHGYIRQEILDRMSEDDRREVQHTCKKSLRGLAGEKITGWFRRIAAAESLAQCHVLVKSETSMVESTACPNLECTLMQAKLLTSPFF
jgi:hypothetical protein